MITHKNLGLNALQAIVKHFSEKVTTTEGGETISTTIANKSEVIEKPSISVFFSKITPNRMSRGLGRQVCFRQYEDPEDNTKIYEYVNAKKYDIDVSLIIYADSNHTALDIAGQVLAVVEEIERTYIEIPHFQNGVPVLNVRPNMSPKILIEQPDFINTTFDVDHKSNSYTAVVRFPAVTMYADSEAVDILSGVSTSSSVNPDSFQ